MIRAFEWIGKAEPWMGVRFYCHRVEGDSYEPSLLRIRAYTESVMRFARDAARGSTERKIKLEQWPVVEVIREGAKYGIRLA